MITMMITKDDNKGDDKKLKDQSRTIQEFKIRIKKNSRLKPPLMLQLYKAYPATLIFSRLDA